MESNTAKLSGVILRDIEFSHEVKGGRIYKTVLACTRMSGVKDCIPVYFAEKLLSDQLVIGSKMYVTGTFRSYNKNDGYTSKKLMFLFADTIEMCDIENDVNDVILTGYVCKDVTYRETPLGKRVTDLLLAVNRRYGHTDYITCIIWGHNAAYASTLNVSDKVFVKGRMQSREYIKRLPDGTEEIRTAIELSVIAIQKDREDK